MILKNKERIIIAVLSLMLLATSCREKEDYRTNCLTKAKYLAKVYDDPTLADDVLYTLSKESLDEFYQEFLINYVHYMDEEQCMELQTLMEESYEEEEKFPYKNTFNHLDNIMGVEEGKYGRGILRAFNMRLVYENILPAWKFDDNIYEEVNTLRMIVNDDDAFFSSLFSKDTEKLIDCIIKHTGIESREEVEELILVFDYYSDIIDKVDYFKDFPEKDYNDEELKDSYERRIEDIMNSLAESKLNTDENFANTLYGRILNSKNDTLPKRYTALRYFLGDYTSIRGRYEYNSYSFSIPSRYLNSNIEIDEAKKIRVCDIIEKGDNEENSYENNAMTLMIHLVDPLSLTSCELTNEEKREILYENLKDEFETIEDFDSFFLTIARGHSMITYDYFNVFEHQLKKDGITLEDFIRYTSLDNFINENEHVYIDWELGKEYPPYEEIKKMKEEEYGKIVASYVNNHIFDGSDYKMCMGMAYDLIKDNDLGYVQLYCPDLQYTYENDVIDLKGSSMSVLSEEIYPTIGSFDGKKVIYYEIPENYENATAVESFYNIERKLTVVHVEGIKETFYDEINGKNVNGFIVKFDDEIDETLTPIRFKEYYTYYQEKKENKRLTLEDK